MEGMKIKIEVVNERRGKFRYRVYADFDNEKKALNELGKQNRLNDVLKDAKELIKDLFIRNEQNCGAIKFQWERNWKIWSEANPELQHINSIINDIQD